MSLTLLGVGSASASAGGGRPAEPSVTVTTQGVDTIPAVQEVPGTAEVFTVGDGVDETVNFGDGVSATGYVAFDAAGVVTDTGPGTPPTGYDGGWSYGYSATFTATAAGEKPDMAKTSGGGGTVTVTVQGVDTIAAQEEIPGVAEVTQISFDGATGGAVVTFQAGATTDPMDWDIDAASMQAALIAVGYSCSVTGSAGEFEVTAEVGEVRADIVILNHTLTK